MELIFWFLVAWFAIDCAAWIIWVIAMDHYIHDRKGLDVVESGVILNQVSGKSKQDGKFVEWMRFIIFPCGIMQRTYEIVKAIKNSEQVQ